jgi:hypothetical protein
MKYFVFYFKFFTFNYAIFLLTSLAAFMATSFATSAAFLPASLATSFATSSAFLQLFSQHLYLISKLH